MKKNIINNKYFYLFLFALSFILMFFYVYSFFKDTFILLNDVATIMPHSCWNNMFDNLEYSCYVSTFIDNIFLVLLPKYFSIHPCDFKADYYSIFQTVILLLFGVLCSSFLSKKINILHCISFVCSIGIIIFFTMISNFPFVMYIASGFSRIFLCVFLFLFCLLLFISIVRKFSIWKYIIFLISIFITGLTHEFVLFLLFLSTVLYLCFSYNNLKSKWYLYLLPMIIEISVSIIYLKVGGFVRHSNGNVLSITDIFYFIPEFLISYFKHIILGHINAYIIFAIQLFLILKIIPKCVIEIEKLKLVCSVLVSLLVFGLMLIFVGKTYAFDGFWCEHSDLKVEYSIILYALNLILLNICLSYKIFNYKIIVTLFLIISIFIFAKNKVFYNDFVMGIIFKERQNLYKIEKIIRLANYKNKNAYLDKDIIFNSRNWGIQPYYDEQSSNIVFDNISYLNFLNGINVDNKISAKIIYSDKDKVDEEYSENGGIFTEDELNNIRFTRLYDEDFITNNK